MSDRKSSGYAITEGALAAVAPSVDAAASSVAGILEQLSRRVRVLAVAGVVAGAVFVPSFGAAPAQAREMALEGAAPVEVQVEASPDASAAGRVQPSNRGASREATPDISTPQKFIEAVSGPAQDSQRETGAPASVTIAQAILESEWGRSGLSVKGQNYFGIKALSGPGPKGTISMNTWEVFGGKDVVIKDAFKAYNNLYESVIDHGVFLKENKRYARAFETSDPKAFAKRMHEAGYATDPAYCTKLGSLIDKYDLTKYDKLP